jgi:hypothetical protein
MSTRPAPSRPRADRPLVRLDPLNRERELPPAETGPEAPNHPADGAEGADGPDGAELLATGAGAMPQVSQ